MSSERSDRRRPKPGLHRFVGVTYGEFQSLYHYGRGRIPRGRMVRLKMKGDGTPSASARKRIPDLLESLPQLMLDDQEGVVILELEPGGERGSFGAEQQSTTKGKKVIEVAIGEVVNVIPTTRRAKRILEPRMRSLGVALDQPRFEGPVLEHWSRRNVANALDGGQALCRLLFGDDAGADEKDGGEGAGDDGGRRLQAAVETAIHQLDRQEGQDVDEEAPATWIPAAYRFTRHDSYDYGAIDYLIDAGHVLKKLSWPEQSNGIERCREVVRGVLGRRSSISSLGDLVGDSEVASLAAALETTAPGLFPSGFRSLVVFCRWKELFHEWRETVDLQALGNEARELVAAGIDFRPVRESLWLLGCFAGHERVAPVRYAAENHSWWCGEKLSIVKVTGPAAGTALEGEAPEEAGERTVGAAAEAAPAKPEAVGAGGLSEESAEPAATGRLETVEADEVAEAAAEPVAVARPEPVGVDEADEASGTIAESAASAEETAKEPGRLPLEPKE